MKEHKQTPEQLNHHLQIKIEAMQTEIELLKMMLLNKDSQLHNQKILSLLDKLIGVASDATEAKQLVRGLVNES